MENRSQKLVFILCLTLIALVVGSYAVGVGLIGETYFSFKSSAWEGFSTFFNNMLSPILAAIAAAIAFFSLTHQLSEARRDASLTEQISNYLNHINILQRMIEKRWNTVSLICNINWDLEPFYAINIENIKEKIPNSSYLSPEIIRLFRLFEDLLSAVQWYTSLHKEKIDLSKHSFPRNEWAHFSTSLIQEQDKKMKFCYEYCIWMLTERNDESEKDLRELLIYQQFYKDLVQEGTLNG